jgi:hypothetical protein
MYTDVSKKPAISIFKVDVTGLKGGLAGQAARGANLHVASRRHCNYRQYFTSKLSVSPAKEFYISPKIIHNLATRPQEFSPALF